MEMKERLAASQAKMDELKAKISGAADNAKAAHEMKKAELEETLDEIDAEFEAFDAAVDAQIEADLADFDAATELIAEEISTEMDDDIATIEGDIAAAKENRRIRKERAESKRNSARLRAQMNVNAAKERIAEKKKAKEQAKREDRALDLLDYADRCQALAMTMTLDAEHAILEAAELLAE